MKKRLFAILSLSFIILSVLSPVTSAAKVRPYPYKIFSSGDAYTKAYTSNVTDIKTLFDNKVLFDGTARFEGYVKGEGKYIDQKAHVTLPENSTFRAAYHYYDKYYYIGSQNEEGHCRIYIKIVADSVESFDATVEDQKKALELEQSGQSMDLFSWRTSNKNSIAEPLKVTKETDGSTLLDLHLYDERSDPAFGYEEILWKIRVFRLEELPNVHVVASCKTEFSIGTGRFLGDYDEEKHGAKYKQMIETHKKEKAEFQKLRIEEYVTTASNYKIDWQEPTILQQFSYDSVTQNASQTPGEDGGVSVPAGIVIGILSGGAAIAGAAAALGGVGGEDGKKKAYKMFVQKDFGDAIRKGADMPSVVRARMAEISEFGQIDRDDLTAQIGVDTSGLILHSAVMSGRYCEATVSAPEDSAQSEGTVTFIFHGEGGEFTNNIIFRLVGGPELKFLAETQTPGEYTPYHNNCGIGAIYGDGFTYTEFFMIDGAPTPPALSDITAVNTGDYDVRFELTDRPAVYKMYVLNNSKPLPDHDVFEKPKDTHFEIHVKVEGEREPVKGYVTVTLYPEGITVTSRDESRRGDVKYVYVQAYEKEHVGDLDKKWQVSEMKLTLAVKGEDKAIIDPKEAQYEFEKLKGSGGKGTRADKEKSLAEKYEYKQSYGMMNEKFTYDFEPQAHLCEPETGFYLVLLPVKCDYKSQIIEADVPFRLKGKEFDPYEDWDKEYKKLRERIEKYSLPEDKDQWMRKLEELAEQDPRPATSHLRLTSKYLVRNYMRYWEIEGIKYRNDAQLYDVIISQLEWVKFAGDCAFSFLINAYAGAVAEAILSPAKDYLAESLGELIACWNHGTQVKPENFSLAKTLESAGENLVTSEISITDWKKAAATLGGYFVFAAFRNLINKAKEKGEFDIWGSLTKAFSDMTLQAFNAAAGDLFKKWVSGNKKVQKWIGENITTHLNKYAGRGRTFNLKDQKITNMQYDLNDKLDLHGNLRKLAGYKGEGKVLISKIGIFEKYFLSFVGKKAGDVKEFVDKTKFRNPGFYTNENGHLAFCIRLEDEDNGVYYATIDLIYALENTATGFFNLLYGQIFGNIPYAPSAIETPKDPPLPPANG